jgi:hypothetical protein
VHLYSNPKHPSPYYLGVLAIRLSLDVQTQMATLQAGLMSWSIARSSGCNPAIFRIPKLSAHRKSNFPTGAPASRTLAIIKQHNSPRIMNLGACGIRGRRKRQGNAPSHTRPLGPNSIQVGDFFHYHPHHFSHPVATGGLPLSRLSFLTDDAAAACN